MNDKTKIAMPTKKWTKERIHQISELEDLLRALSLLDKSTGAITDLPRLIRSASELLRVKDSGDWKNLIQFLTDLSFVENKS